MAAVIKFSYDEVEQIARELEQIAAESAELNNRTRNILDKLSSSWTGDMMETFTERIMTSSHDEEQKVQLLQQLSEYIRQAMQTYSLADSSLAESIREMFKS